MAVKQRWTGIALVVTLAIVAMLPAATEARQIGLYFERETGQIFPSQVGYVYHRDFGLELKLDGPQDLFLDHEENLWIADTGNNRVIKTDKYGNLLMVVGTSGEGRLRRPQGVYVNQQGDIFVADTENNRVVQFNPDGTLNRVLPKPESVILGEDFNYQPTKLVQDHRGYLYVVNSNDYRGLMQLDAEGIFRGFFAPNRVPFSIRRLLIQWFATQEQKDKLSRDLPTPHSNLFLSDDGFIYTSTIYERQNQIKKLNLVGKNVYVEQEYGLYARRGYQVTPPSIIALAVDHKGVISAVDSAHGYVYQYDQEGNLLLMFGDKGEHRGAFGFPTAIEVDSEGFIYVLDKDRNNVQVFRPTQFAELVHTAAQLYNDGRYDEAALPWREVLRYNSNYSLAHSGIAKAYMRLEMWDEALHHYYLAKNREGYSEAFIEKRYEFMRNNFGIVVLGIVVVGALIYAAFRFAGWVLKQDYETSHPIVQTLQMMFRVLLNPGEAFYDLKYGGRGQISAALILILLCFAVRVFNIQFMSFQIHRVDPDKVSLLAEIARIFGLWLLFGIANYGVGAIFEGEAFFKDVLIATAYATAPYLLFSWPLTLATHVMSRNELGLVDAINVAILYWVGMLVFIAVRTIHDYTIRKALGTSALTIFGMAVIIGVLALGYALTEQMFSFAREIMVELTIRT